MRNIFKKIAPGIVITSLLLIVGIFFGGSTALASNGSGSAEDCGMNMPIAHAARNCESVSPAAHIKDDCNIMAKRGIKKTSPTKNTFMPCCLERRDNSETTIPSVLQERIKFSEYSIVGETAGALLATEQKTYLSSKSPPKKADILSSVVKIE